MKDILTTYYVNKQPDTDVNIKKVITSIINHVQNNEVYFHSDIKFVQGVLMFSIVGFEKEQLKFQFEVGSKLKELNCSLFILCKRDMENKESKNDKDSK